MCQGYVTQDRRKAHVVEADKKLAELLANRPEQEDEAEPQEVEGEGEGEPVLGDLSKAKEYQNLIEVCGLHRLLLSFTLMPTASCIRGLVAIVEMNYVQLR